MCNTTKERRPLIRTRETASAFSRPYVRPMFGHSNRDDKNSKYRRANQLQCVKLFALSAIGALLLASGVATISKYSLLESVRLRGKAANQYSTPAGEELIDTSSISHPLPAWATKSPSSTLYPPPYEIPASKQVCLVHVGKTAGSTIGCQLGFNLHCSPDRVVAPGLLARYTTHMFHTNIYDCPDDVPYYLFVVRNPLERIKSAFAYDKPKDWDEFRSTMGEKYYWLRKRLYDDCSFDTLEDMALRGLRNQTTDAKGAADPECQRRAVASLLGTEHFGCHFYYNYQFHVEGIPSNATIVTIRTEHIVHDWNTVELELGGQDNIMGSPDKAVVKKNNVNTNKADSDKFLSDESIIEICRLLCNDIQMYKEILERSINLDKAQIALSMADLRASCPKEASASTCDTAKPDIKQKLLESRGYEGQTKIVSPYEKHWQGQWNLPDKMTKDYTKYPAKTSPDNEVCFVHVGKGAGVSVGCALGFNLPDCPNSGSLTSGLLPQYTTRQFHCGIYDCFDDSAYYMFVVSNPVARFIAAFNSDMPTDWEAFRSKEGDRQYKFHKELFQDCPFNSVEELISLGIANNGLGNETSKECQQRALGAIDGTGHFGTQMFYNYQYYAEGLPLGANVIVIRSEHTIDDWNSAESTVGGVSHILRSDQSQFKSVESGSAVSDLSEESTALLCEKLCNEIQVYKKIIGAAVNLSPEEKGRSLDELKESCPKEVAVDSCEVALPDITSKLYLSRGYEENLRLDLPTGDVTIGRSLHPQPPSPYEQIWPDLKLPLYMKKDRQFAIESVPSDKKTCFVHVGKTAGSTVGCAIGFNLHCSSKVTAAGVFPMYATHMFHAQMYDCEDDSAFFVFVVRNPVERMISAFNYDNPSKDWGKFRVEYGEKHYQFRKKLYMDCPFNTFDDLAQLGLSSNGNATAECRNRAAAAIEGTEHFGCHFFFNYQYHLEAVPTDATIMTIRTEHLVEDWNSVEYNLGGEREILGTDQTVLTYTNVNTASGDEFKHLSNDSMELICERLCNEIQVYKKILRRSINLSEKQVNESIEELIKSCANAASESCPSPLPDITEKLTNSRGYLKT
ncbi:hypothetical protein ACHAXN_001061 [Cyclotella atomus]